MPKPNQSTDATAHERRTPRSARLLDQLQVGNKYKMHGNLYNNALMAQLGVPGIDDKPSIWNFPKKHGPACLMVIMTAIQLMMAWAVYLGVYNNMIFTNTRPLLTAYEMFVGSNVTIPLHTTEALCGEWEDHEMKDFAQGPLSYMKTSDGSVFSPDDSYSLFYNVKQPDRSWDYAALGTHRAVLDDALFVISEGLTLNPFTPNAYSSLFILTLCLLYMTLLIELRQIGRFASMLITLSGRDGPAFKQEDDGAWSLVRVSRGGQVVGCIAVVCRLAVAVVLSMLGSLFLMYTTLKIDLILNGLALAFLIELNVMVFYAIVPAPRQSFLQKLEPVEYNSSEGFIGSFSAMQVAPIIMGPLAFLCACLMRSWQIKIFQRIFRLTSAICLFAGPTTPFARHDIVHPVAGFCDSLLGVKCAPHVEPLLTREEHGYCIVTDKTVTNNPTFSFYLDDPKLIANRYDENGIMKSWVEWGDSNPKLYKSDLWMDGPYQDLLRKNCLQMYQKTVKPDDVLVDDDAGETMDGAPFQCPRDELFKAVFGKVFDSLDKMPLQKMIDQVADLTDPAVVRAVDNCKSYKEPATKVDKESALVETSAALTEGGARPLPASFSQTARSTERSPSAVSGTRMPQATRKHGKQQTYLRHNKP
mmetsp:Transcript_92336/g.160389  ORF Transcript_92336/g.160389 Transcript_92336/m.160389 type:complete len:643 (+) Transcript_92336:138-2066(+)